MPLLVSSIVLLLVYGANYTLGQGLADLRILFPFAVMPPGYVFAIMRSLIYGLLLVAFFSFRIHTKPTPTANEFPHQLFWLSSFFNILRIISTRFSAHVFSVFILFWLFGVLWVILTYFSSEQQENSKQRRLFHTTFSLYLGWVMTASSVIATSQFVYIFWGDFALSLTWQVIALLLGVLAWAIALRKFKQPIVVLPLVFALIALGFSRFPSYAIISGLAFLGAIFLIVLACRGFKKWRIVHNKE